MALRLRPAQGAATANVHPGGGACCPQQSRGPAARFHSNGGRRSVSLRGGSAVASNGVRHAVLRASNVGGVYSRRSRAPLGPAPSGRPGSHIVHASGNSSNENSLPRPLAWLLSTLFGGKVAFTQQQQQQPQTSQQQQKSQQLLRQSQQSGAVSSGDEDPAGASAQDEGSAAFPEPGFATNMSGSPDEPVSPLLTPALAPRITFETFESIESMVSGLCSCYVMRSFVTPPGIAQGQACCGAVWD